jgi:hypothetical protein
MSRGPLKSRIVAVKVEAELAEFLNRLPNKSDFIRKAILAQFGTACPLCEGSGQVPAAIGQPYGPVLRRHRERACLKCGTVEAIPFDLSVVMEADRPRWEQFFHGGPFFCANCFAVAAACGECGWYYSPELIANHPHHASNDRGRGTNEAGESNEERRGRGRRRGTDRT